MKRKKNPEEKPLFDLSKFEEWFALTYNPRNFGAIKVPKIISFKEHIRILKEKDNQYHSLLNEYNKLVDAYNHLQTAFIEKTGEFPSTEHEVERMNLEYIRITELEEENQELKFLNKQLRQQIEKMKNHNNCKWFHEWNLADIMDEPLDDLSPCQGCKSFSLWELAE